MADTNQNKKTKSEDEQKFNLIVRIGGTDIDGNKPLFMGLRKIKGVEEPFANMVCHVTGLSKDKQIGVLTPDEIQTITDVLKNPLNYGAPNWLLNHCNDMETGEDAHYVGTNLRLKVDEDTKLLKKIKTYKGLRHSWRVPVRGQRTKSNFRKNKGKAVSVKKTTIKH